MIVSEAPDMSDPRVCTLWLGIHKNRWVPKRPHPVTGEEGPTTRQLAFLLCPEKEALYGGSARGGKTDAMLMGAVQFADYPNYRALIVRETFTQLKQSGGVLDRARDWFADTGATWKELDHTWRFPSGATLSFGHLQYDGDEKQYSGGDYNYIGVDEACLLKMKRINFLASRLSRKLGEKIPGRLRLATNPGDEKGCSYGLYERFVVGQFPFFPANLYDNPYIDQADYVDSLSHLDDVTRARLLKGQWIIDPSRCVYDMKWWSRGKNRFDASKSARERRVVARYTSWDTSQKNEDENAFTARVELELTADFTIHVRDIWKKRILGAEVPDYILNDSLRLDRKDLYVPDGQSRPKGGLTQVIIEDRSSGSTAIQTLRVHPVIGKRIISFNPQLFGDKMVDRPTAAATRCKEGSVLLPHPGPEVPWLAEFEQHLSMWPTVPYYDDKDAFHQGVIYLKNYLLSGAARRRMAA